MNNYGTVICFVLLLFQDKAPPDYAGYIAPVLAALATLFTGYGAWQQSKSKGKTDSVESALKAWQLVFDRQGKEIDALKDSGREDRIHREICDRRLLRIVAQLQKAGIEIDLERIIGDVSKLEELLTESQLRKQAPNQNQTLKDEKSQNAE